MQPRHADRFDLLPAEQAAPWQNYARWEKPWLAKHLGIVFEEVRCDYARMRLPARTEVMQPQGVVHGGAIASLIDTAVVPAIGAWYDHRVAMVTVTLNVDFLAAARGDIVAEAWVTKRGNSSVFCQAEVYEDESETLVATGSLVYRVRPL